MKPTQEQLEDRLIDALLKQQADAGKTEHALRGIEEALDADSTPASRPVMSPWRVRLGIIAACAMIGCLVVLGIQSSRVSEANALAATRAAALESERAKQEDLAKLDQAIRDQEDKVEERRKVLANLVRNKGIVYKGQDSFYGEAVADGGTLAKEEAIGRSMDAQDYVDAKRDFESDQERLIEMKMRQINLGIEERIAATDRSQPTDPKSDLPPLPPLSEIAENAAPASAMSPGQLKPRVVPPPTPAKQELLAQLRSEGTATRPEVDTFGRDAALSVAKAGSGSGRGVGLGRGMGAVDASNMPRFRAPIDDLGRGLVIPGHDSVPAENPNTERYGSLVDPKWQRPSEVPLSTFSIDVDNASYSNIRRFIHNGQAIPPDAVRIEECINAFDYGYAKPAGDQAFAVHTTLATCPWDADHLLLKVGIKGREIPAEQRPVSNLVFLIDVSGSMQSSDKLPLVKESLKLLLHQLDERDSVSYVVYAGRQGVVLPPTKMTESGRAAALEALGKLESGGSTNGGAGIQRAYQIAREMFIKGGVNRVILATDGDFNVGITDQSQLVQLVKERAADNIYLSVLGFGTGNLNDALMESISKDGNGNHYYIDSIREGRKVLLQRLSGTLITIAKDVKIQIEFNPSKVGSYRLIGYANRQLRDEDFNNDKVDAGDIGAGHTVTAFYEIVPAGKPQPNGGGVDALKYQKPAEKPVEIESEPSNEWLTLKLRHKTPEGDISSLQESVVEGPAVRWQDADADFSFASAVALFGMKLRCMDEARSVSWAQVRDLATPGLRNDLHENRAEFMGLLEALEKRGN